MALYFPPEFSALVGQAQTAADAYAWQRGMMQSLQEGTPDARWLLKAPSHVMNMDALIAVFPDARIFLNHRDPGKVIPSMASLYMKLYILASDKSVDPLSLGPRLVSNWGGILERLDAWRAAHPEVMVVDVRYASPIADPIGTVDRLYGAYGYAMNEAARASMRDHLAADHHGKAAARTYGLADFGLCEDDIEAAFGAYIDRQGIKRERRT